MQKIYIGNKYIGDAYVGINSVYPNLAPTPAPPTSSFDVDAIAYFDATGITNESLQIAVNDFIVDLKDNSLWSKFEDGFIFPFVTDKTVTEDIIDQFSINLVNPTGFTSSFFNPQFGQFSYSGFKSNRDPNAVPINESSASWMSTNFNIQATYGDDSYTHMSFYTNELWNENVGIDFGAYGGPAGWYFLGYRNGKIYSLIGNNGVDDAFPDTVANRGFLLGTYNPSTDPKVTTYSNSEVVYEYNSNGDFPTDALFLGRYNPANVPNGDPNQTITKTYQFASFGVGMSSAEVGIFNELVNNLQYNVDTIFSTDRLILNNVEYLMVAGGGAGGYPENASGGTGGGGAGGMLEGTTTLAAGTYPIVVGTGGVESSTFSRGNNGGNSTAFGLTAIGGGGGGAARAGSTTRLPASGGSGGGAGGVATGGAGTTGQGFDGASGSSSTAKTGGGGAGSVGSNTGTGGSGKVANIDGQLYAKGGNVYTDGSSVNTQPGSGGAGGLLLQPNVRPVMAGKNGIVKIKYKGTPKATGGTITESDGFTTHTFTSNGNFVLS
jgi:hypothetical protein